MWLETNRPHLRPVDTSPGTSYHLAHTMQLGVRGVEGEKKEEKSLRHISSAIYLAGCSSPLTLRRFVHYQPDRALLWTASSLRVTCWV